MKIKSTTLSIRIKEDKKKELIELAEKKKWSVNKYMNELIEAHLKKFKK